MIEDHIDITPGSMETQPSLPIRAKQKAIGAWISPNPITPSSNLPAIYNADIADADLHQLEDLVERGLKAFYIAGVALRRIDNDGLWCETHDSFQGYCKDRFGLDPSYRKRLIVSSKTIDNLKQLAPIGASKTKGSQIPLPFNESQTRPLSKLPPEQQATAWHLALTLSDNKPTAKIVAEAVQQVLGKAKKKAVARVRKPTFEIDDLPEPFKGYVMQFGKELAKIIDSGFEEVPQSFCRKMLQTFTEGVS